MNLMKRMIPILLALLLTLGVFGCSKPQENDPNATAEPGATDAPGADADSFDRDAVAVELGSIKITAGEIADSYSYYMSMLESYYGSVPTDDASIKEYRDMAVDDLIRYNVPSWKAAALGLSLSAEQEATLEAITGQEIEEMRSELICDYAYYYADADADDISELTEEQIDIALNQIASELSTYFYEGYTLDQYLNEQFDSVLNDKRMEMLRDLLKRSSLGAVAITDEQVTEWYTEELTSQQEDFAADPLKFREQLDAYNSGETGVPALYLPEGFMKVQVIKVFPEAERDLTIDTDRAEMAKLEAEYGALVLNGENTLRQAEIATRYAELKAEIEALEELYLGEARGTINAAYEELEEEADFEDVMQRVNVDGAIELYLYTDGEDSEYEELAEAAKSILVGTYSEPLLINDVYYIIKRVETPKAGVLDRAAFEDDIRTAATEELIETTWDALYEEWETEANQAAIRHEETYAAVGYLNQY